VSRASRISLLALFGLVALVAASGCGSGEDQDLIREERRDAAESARQDERVRQLQREVKELDKGQRQTTTTTAPPATATITVESPSSAPASGDDWPGGSGHTAVLASVQSESEAREIQSQATSRGLDSGVLYSSDYRSLRPGYWVVFSGAFGSQAEASERAARAQSLGYGDAYPRFVSP